MNKNLKLFLLGILLIIVTDYYFSVLNEILFSNMYKWTYEIFGVYIHVIFSPIDLILILLSPLMMTITQIKQKDHRPGILILDSFICICTIICLIIIGIIFAIFTWGPHKDTLLPEYYRSAPSLFYFTGFIILAIIITIYGKLTLRKEHMMEE